MKKEEIIQTLKAKIEHLDHILKVTDYDSYTVGKSVGMKDAFEYCLEKIEESETSLITEKEVMNLIKETFERNVGGTVDETFCVVLTIDFNTLVKNRIESDAVLLLDFVLKNGYYRNYGKWTNNIGNFYTSSEIYNSQEFKDYKNNLNK